MHRLPWLTSLLLLVVVGRAPAADEVDRLLRDVRAVTAQGGGSKQARAAWDRLVREGPAVLPRLLEAMDTPDTVAANWLRSAFERVVRPELKAGGKRIPVAALLAFARDPKRQGRARRLALDVVEELRPGTRDRLVQGWLDDPEFRYDAVARLVAEVAGKKNLPKADAIAAYRRAFTAARDLDQAQAIAVRLKELGVVVSVADHLGFLRDWYVVGPFDAHGQKGFTTVYPPERKVDLTAAYEGKGGKKIRWQRFTVRETPGLRFSALVNLRQPLGDASDAVAYAYTAFACADARTVEFRGAGDDNLSVWVNGVKAFAFEEYRNGVRLDRHRFRVRLRPGVNTVLVKVCQAPHDPNSPDPNWEFVLRVVDLAGKGLLFPSRLPASRSPTPAPGKIP